MKACYKKIMSSFNPSMEDLPPNIVADVLSRLPVITIIHCKSVCKKWRELISDSYFVNIHLSKSPICVMIHHKVEPDLVSDSEDEMSSLEIPGVLKCLEIDETHLRHDGVMSLDLNLIPTFENSNMIQVGSGNGLIFLWQYLNGNFNTYICNPITREYMIFPRPQYIGIPSLGTHGFGVGLRTKEYKVIWIFLGDIQPNTTSSQPRLFEAEIYTLGTGQWRRLGHVPYLIDSSHGPFLNGCVHWIVCDKDSPEKLCAFDIDNETFQLFPSPPSEVLEGDICHQGLGVLNGCLSQSVSSDVEFVIWIMKEYGIKKSWCKEMVIKICMEPYVDWCLNETVYLMESLDNGTIFMLINENSLLAYCPREKTVEEIPFFESYFTGKPYRPSFLKLQTFEPERVHAL